MTENMIRIEKEADQILWLEADDYGVEVGLDGVRVTLTPSEVLLLQAFLGRTVDKWDGEEI